MVVRIFLLWAKAKEVALWITRQTMNLCPSGFQARNLSALTGRSAGWKDMSIITSSKTLIATASISIFKSINLSAIPKKSTLNLPVFLSLSRRHDVLCQGARGWTGLWISPNGATQEEISLEKNELHNWPAKAASLRDLRGSFSNESPSDWREWKRLIPNARGDSLLRGEELQWGQWIHPMPRKIGRPQEGYSGLGVPKLFRGWTRWFLPAVRFPPQLHDSPEAVIVNFPAKYHSSSFISSCYQSDTLVRITIKSTRERKIENKDCVIIPFAELFESSSIGIVYQLGPGSKLRQLFQRKSNIKSVSGEKMFP